MSNGVAACCLCLEASALPTALASKDDAEQMYLGSSETKLSAAGLGCSSAAVLGPVKLQTYFLISCVLLQQDIMPNDHRSDVRSMSKVQR